MKKLVTCLMIAFSFSSLACEINVLTEGADGLDQTVTSLLEKKGYIVTHVTERSQADVKVFVFGEEKLCWQGRPTAFEVKVVNMLKGKGGYTIEHSLAGGPLRKHKTYKLRRYANQENIDLAVESYLNRTVPECR